MSRRMYRFFTVMIILLLAYPAAANTKQGFLFWYPGEAGNTTEAQPLMDTFAAHLSAKTPATTWQATYMADVAGGKRYIQKQRPTFGIVSHLMFERYGAQYGMRKLLATRPLPHGKTTETWHLIRPPCQGPLPKAIIHVTEPVTEATIVAAFAPELVAEIERPMEIEPTGNLLHALREIARGRCNYALLNEREWWAVSNVGSDWSKQLVATTSQQTHSTALLVQFGKASDTTDALTATLRAMANDSHGQQILATLRLKGF